LDARLETQLAALERAVFGQSPDANSPAVADAPRSRNESGGV
jgi:hypothetical protein